MLSNQNAAQTARKDRGRKKSQSMVFRQTALPAPKDLKKKMFS
jgi:hypothetical protein